MNTLKEQDSIFLPLHSDIVQEIRDDPLSLHARFLVNGSNQEMDVIMTSKYIAIGEKTFIDYEFLCFTQMDFDLKFEVLFKNSPQNQKNSMNSKAYGFKLMKKGAKDVVF